MFYDLSVVRNENTGHMEKGNSFCMCLFVYRFFVYKKWNCPYDAKYSVGILLQQSEILKKV